jgi:uncharacterized protein YdhG (YjbR/CyaY superfamily)
MKKAKSATGPSPAKRKPAPKTVGEYVTRVPRRARKTFNDIRAAVRSAVPADAKETISYGIPALKHNGVLVWYAAFSNHCSLFPTARVIEALQEELKGFAVSKGTIQFPLDKPVPTRLIKKLVKVRIGQRGRK